MQSIINMDGQILLFIQEHLRKEALDAPMKIITMLADKGWFWILLALVMLCFKKTRKNGIASAIALMCGVLITNICLKNTVARIRPYEVIDGLTLLVERADDWSFPSGHATASLAVSWVLMRKERKWLAIPAFILALLICYSRLYVGIHYPTDVLCGMVVGIVAAEVGIALSKPVNKFVRRKIKACKKAKKAKR